MTWDVLRYGGRSNSAVRRLYSGDDADRAQTIYERECRAMRRGVTRLYLDDTLACESTTGFLPANQRLGKESKQ